MKSEYSEIMQDLPHVCIRELHLHDETMQFCSRLPPTTLSKITEVLVDMGLSALEPYIRNPSQP